MICYLAAGWLGLQSEPVMDREASQDHFLVCPGSCPLIDRLPGCPLAAAARERKFNDVRAKNSTRTPLQSLEAFVCTQQIPHLQPHFQCPPLSGRSTVPTELAWLAFPSDNAGVPLRHCGKTIIPTSLLLPISVCHVPPYQHRDARKSYLFHDILCSIDLLANLSPRLAI